MLKNKKLLAFILVVAFWIGVGVGLYKWCDREAPPRDIIKLYLNTPEGYVERNFYVDSYNPSGNVTRYSVTNCYDLKTSSLNVNRGGTLTWYDADHNILWQTTDFIIINTTRHSNYASDDYKLIQEEIKEVTFNTE